MNFFPPNFRPPQSQQDTELYDILGVQKDCDIKNIKKQYRKLALKYHPDRNAGSNKADAEVQFKKISEAYEILSDPEKRKVYDSFGLQAVRESGAGSAPSTMNHIFENMPSFFTGGTQHFSRAQKKHKLVRVDATLSDVMNGATKTVHFTRKEIIDRENISVCKACGGKGKLIHMIQLGPGMISQNITPCTECEGVGKIVNCIEVDKTASVNVPPGSTTGDKIVVSGMGDETVDASEQGDLIVTVVVEKNEHFEKNGDNLLYRRNICLSEALAGLELKVHHPSGKDIILRCDDIIQPGVVKIVPDLGFPNKKNPLRRGHLLIEFSIQFPTKLTVKQKDLLKKLLPTRSKVSEKELQSLSCYDIDTYCPSLHGESEDHEERHESGHPPDCVQQ